MSNEQDAQSCQQPDSLGIPGGTHSGKYSDLPPAAASEAKEWTWDQVKDWYEISGFAGIKIHHNATVAALRQELAEAKDKYETELDRGESWCRLEIKQRKRAEQAEADRDKLRRELEESITATEDLATNRDQWQERAEKAETTVGVLHDTCRDYETRLGAYDPVPSEPCQDKDEEAQLWTRRAYSVFGPDGKLAFNCAHSNDARDAVDKINAALRHARAQVEGKP